MRIFQTSRSTHASISSFLRVGSCAAPCLCFFALITRRSTGRISKRFQKHGRARAFLFVPAEYTIYIARAASDGHRNDTPRDGEPRIPYMAGRLVGNIRRYTSCSARNTRPPPASFFSKRPTGARKMPTGTGFPFGRVFSAFPRLPFALRCTRRRRFRFSPRLPDLALCLSLQAASRPRAAIASERKWPSAVRTRNGAKNRGVRRRRIGRRPKMEK